MSERGGKEETNKIRRYQPINMRPAGQAKPHSHARCGASREVIAGEYDEGPSARAGANLLGDEASSGVKRPGPENTGETTFRVSEAWLAAGKAGELASVLGEVEAALVREVACLEVHKKVLIRERDELETEAYMLEGMVWHANEDAHKHRMNLEVDLENDFRELGEWLEGVMLEVREEAVAVECERLEVVHHRQAVGQRGARIRAVGVGLGSLASRERRQDRAR